MKAISVKTKRRFMLGLILATTLSGCVYGYNIGSISGVLAGMGNDIAYSATQESLFVSSFLWGNVVMMLLNGPLADRFGRKLAMIFAGVFAAISVIIMGFAANIYMLILGRLLMGMSTGTLLMVSPLYLAEILPEDIRGRGTSGYPLCLTFSILLSTLISWYFLNSGAWRPILFIEIVPVILLLLVACFVPESPRWLLIHKKEKEALAVLSKLQSPKNAEKTLEEMRPKPSQQKGIPFWQTLRKAQFLFPFILVTLLGVLTQLTGVNAILQYDAFLLYLPGISPKNSGMVASVILTAINFVTTCLGIFIIDKIERKKVLQFGTAGIVLCLVGTALTFFFISGTQGRFISTGFLLAYMFCFAISPGLVVTTLMSELLPSEIRGIGLSMALLITSIAGASVTALYLPLKSIIGEGGFFAICAIASALFFLVCAFIPKTNKRSLEEIEKAVKKHSKELVGG